MFRGINVIVEAGMIPCLRTVPEKKTRLYAYKKNKRKKRK